MHVLGQGQTGLPPPPQAPHNGGAAALTWPNIARVSLKCGSGAGDEDGPRLVKFPLCGVVGGPFAALQVRD